MGRPAKYKTPEELEAAINAYFEDCDKREVPYTVPGMAYFLGFSDRHSILDYKGKKKFNATIKKALVKIESQRVEKLLKGEVNPAGAIFDLKNNFGYEDARKVDMQGKVALDHTVFVVPGFDGSNDDDEDSQKK